MFTLSACSSNAPPKGAKPVFQTRITDSGLKHFQVFFRFDKSAGINNDVQKPSRKKRRTSGKGERNRYKKTQQQLIDLANIETERSQYCRKGFWVLKNDADARVPFLRGECNDQASPADRQAYPDTIKNW